MIAMNNSATGLPTNKSILFNRFMYGAFVLLSVYYFFLNKDVSSAMSNLGIALIFDPFDQRVVWDNRPRFQKVWLCIHVATVFSMMTYLVFHYFNQ